MADPREVYISHMAAAREKLRREVRLDFFSFAKVVLGYDLYRDVHGPLCDAMQNAYWGRGEHRISGGIDRHLYLMPRGTYKSTVASQAFPIWVQTQNDPRSARKDNSWEPPRSFNGKLGYNQMFIQGSEIDANVQKFVTTQQDLIQSCPMLLELFGNLYPANLLGKRRKWSKTAYNNAWRDDFRTKDPNVGTCSLESAANSTHGDMMIVDDLVGEKQAGTQVGFAATVDFYRRSIPISNNPSIQFWIGTRWHDRDLYGYFLESEEERGKWHAIIERAIRTEQEIAAGKRRLFFPQVLSDSVLEDKRTSMRPSLFSCNYLNEPIDEETALFKPSYFEDCYFELPVGDKLDAWLSTKAVFTTADTAISDDREACESCIITAAWDHLGHMWVLEVWAKKGANPSEFIDELFTQNERWKPRWMGVEKTVLERVIRFFADRKSQEIGVWPPWKELSHGNRKKPDRIFALEPYARQHKIHLRHGMEALETQMVRYPKADLVDQIDTLAYQVDISHTPTHEENQEEQQEERRIVRPTELAAAHHKYLQSLGIRKCDTQKAARSWRTL